VRAAATPLERLRRQALADAADRLWFHSDGVSYSVGDHVWARFGNTRGLQLARIRMANPVAFEGTSAVWWWVDVWWPTRARWISTHRRVLRSLTSAELRRCREAGVWRTDQPALEAS
jgi:pyrroloquinoline quinone (PQQ) biosynthesis protein C